MRVPIRKPGKYAYLKTDYSITAEKYIELKEKLEKLENVSRFRAAEEVKRLAEMGDFSENYAYQIAKGKLRGINQRIIDIEDMLKRAEIIEPTKNSGFVQLGNFVTVEFDGKKKTYQILGSAETNPEKNIISHNSPIGSALLNKRIGETIIIKLKNKTINYKIIKIE